MSAKRLQDQIETVASLADPVRRDLYLYVRRQGEPVGRDQAAKGLGISRALAAFHLDKLAAAGLLETSFRRLKGRGGPGAGRPSKLYAPSAEPIELQLPERRYQTAGKVMARALAEGESRTALRRAARAEGKRLALAAPAKGSAASRTMAALRDAGFEPARDRDGRVTLKNCPFDALARESREVVCGMNLALVEGMLEELGIEGASAKLEPRPGQCCVSLRLAREA